MVADSIADQSRKLNLAEYCETFEAHFSAESQKFALPRCSGAQEEERGSTAEAEDDLQRRTDPETGGRIPAGGVHLEGTQIRARGFLETHRDADQDLVPEQACQRQKNREGAAGSAVPVLVRSILLRLFRGSILARFKRNIPIKDSQPEFVPSPSVNYRSLRW